MKKSLMGGTAAALALATPAAAQDGVPGPAEDPYIWLEEVEGERALGWVEAENLRAVGKFSRDPLYAELYRDALTQLEANDRIPTISMRPDAVYNFWQDANHVRGILRRTSFESYRTDAPQWETVLDFDALGEADGKSWVYKGINCLMPEQRYCLISISDGGRDEVEIREFDLHRGVFVEGGFRFPEGRQFIEWIDRDHLLVARDWDGQSLTESLYPETLKILRRGQSMDEAELFFRGKKSDVGVFGQVLRDSNGIVHGMGAMRYLDAFNGEKLFKVGQELVAFDIPSKASVLGIVDGHVMVSLSEAWQYDADTRFPADGLLAYELSSWKADPNGTRPALVWEPAERQTRIGMNITSDALYVGLLDNVRGKALRIDRIGDGWTSRLIDLPDNSVVSVMGGSDSEDKIMFLVENSVTPDRLYIYDGGANDVTLLKQLPARFDTSNVTLEQREATSRDGTVIPYFVVRPVDAPMDGTTPTLLNGYGGFQSPQLPYYSGTTGKLWVERGNAYVIANLRGGGEFGPDWHQTAQKANKQRTWDDFIAVAEDLVASGLTSPEHLGVIGGSQGGLLVGTIMTQRPELIKAAIVQVPLFDMLRYHLIGNGASWIGEYGDPRVAEERAWIEGYSPYQKLVEGVDFPTAFFVTSTADDRVTPVHGRKAAARMAELGEEYYYYENVEGGHAASADARQLAHRLALEMTFMNRELGGK